MISLTKLNNIEYRFDETLCKYQLVLNVDPGYVDDPVALADVEVVRSMCDGHLFELDTEDFKSTIVYCQDLL